MKKLCRWRSLPVAAVLLGATLHGGAQEPATRATEGGQVAPVVADALETPEPAAIRPFPFPELRDRRWIEAIGEFGLDGDTDFRPGTMVVPAAEAERTQTAQRLFFIGSYHYAAEEFESALQAFRNALEFDAENPAILLATAEAELRLDAPSDAVRLCDAVIRVRPDDPEAWVLRGTALDQLGQRLDAIASFERALERRPHHKRALESLGATYFSLMRIDEGIATYERLVAVEPSSLRGLFYLSFGHQVKNDIDGALHYITEAIAYYPGHGPLYDFQLSLLQKAGRREEYVAAVREAILRAGDKPAFLRLYNQHVVGSLQDAALVRLFARQQLPDMILRAFEYPPIDLGEARASVYVQRVAEALLPAYEEFATARPETWAPHYYHARLLELAGDDAGAVAAYTRAIERGDRRGRLNLRVGELLGAMALAPEAEQAFAAAREAEPFWSRPYVELGRLQRRTFRYEEARETFSQGLALDPTNVDLALALAEANLILGEVEPAISVLNDALTRVGPDARLYRELAHAFLLLDRADLARRNMQRAVDLEEGNLDLLTDLLRLQIEADDAEAEETFASAVALDFGLVHPDVTRRFLWMLIRHAEVERTLEAIDRLLESSPPRPDLALAFLVELAERHRERAIELGARELGARVARSIAPESLRLAATLRVESLLGDAAGAVDGYRSALDGGPSIPATEGWLRLATTLESLDRLDEAVAALAHGIAASAGADARFLAIRRVEMLLRHGRAAEAQEAADVLLSAAAAGDTTLRADLAGILQGAGRLDLAERLYREALTVAPDNPVLLNNLAYLYATRGDRLGEALTMARRALELLPEAGFVMDTLGWVYFQMGEDEQAVRYLEAALRMSEWDAELYDHLGDVHRRMGRIDKARSYYRRALNLSPDDDTIASKMRELP